LIRLALLSLWRERRSGPLLLLAMCLVLGTSVLSAASLFTARLERGLTEQGAELLGGDLLVQGSQVQPDAWASAAQQLGLGTARHAEFTSMLQAGEAIALAEIKAATPAYPLRGQLLLRREDHGLQTAVTGPPPAGEVWLEPRLADALGVRIGDTVQLGQLSLRVSARLMFEPDRSTGLFNLAPRALIAHQDLAASGLLGPGSRVRHSLLLAGEAAALASWRQAHPQAEQVGQKLLTPEEGRPEMIQILQRARQFLGLAAMAAVLLAGAGTAVVSLYWLRRRQTTVAVLEACGLTPARVLGWHAGLLLWLAWLAGLAGTALGGLLQLGLAELLAGLTNGDLPPPDARAWMAGPLFAVAMMAGFALPMLGNLRALPPAALLRQSLPPAARWRAGLGAAVLMTALLLGWFLRELKLALVALGAAVAAWLLLALLSALLLRFLPVLLKSAPAAWRIGAQALQRRRASAAAQGAGLGLTLTLLLVLLFVRGDILSQWREQVPPGTPNTFLINVQPEEREAVQAGLAALGVGEVRLYPMVRGRLLARNGEPYRSEALSDDRARRLLLREFNLSYADELPWGNRITAGQWHPPTGGAQQLSVEVGVARTFGIRVGDVLHFRIADADIQAPVTSLRELRWDSFRVNFFIIASPGLLEDKPATWITSVYLPPGAGPGLRDLLKRHPGVTALEVETLMAQLRGVLDRLSLAVELLTGFGLLAGLLLLAAVWQATSLDRQYESALLRAFGAPAAWLRRAVLAEYLLLGAVAGASAALAAGGAHAALAHWVLDLPLRLNPWMSLASLAAGICLASVMGLAGTRAVLRASPMSLLRAG
jgi:putative ABC transport system permease protein